MKYIEVCVGIPMCIFEKNFAVTQFKSIRLKLWKD